MVWKERPGQDLEPRPLDHRGKPRDEIRPVPVVAEERAPLDPANHHVMERARPIEARSARHGETLVGGKGGVKEKYKQYPTSPFPLVPLSPPIEARSARHGERLVGKKGGVKEKYKKYPTSLFPVVPLSRPPFRRPPSLRPPFVRACSAPEGSGWLPEAGLDTHSRAT